MGEFGLKIRGSYRSEMAKSGCKRERNAGYFNRESFRPKQTAEGMRVPSIVACVSTRPAASSFAWQRNA